MDGNLKDMCGDLFLALPWLIKWLLYLGLAALVVHLILEVVDRIMKFWTPATRYREAPDPIKLIDALKGFLEALKNAPLWIAIFVLAITFWFVAQTEPPSVCATAGPSGAGQTTQPTATPPKGPGA
jgi:hypothetical protein